MKNNFRKHISTVLFVLGTINILTFLVLTLLRVFSDIPPGPMPSSYLAAFGTIQLGISALLDKE